MFVSRKILIKFSIVPFSSWLKILVFMLIIFVVHTKISLNRAVFISFCFKFDNDYLDFPLWLPSKKFLLEFSRIELTYISLAIEDEPVSVCFPSPCGPNSHCSENNGVAKCSCAPGFIGSGLSCRPECVLNSDCSLDQVCYNLKCVNTCTLDVCGQNAVCSVNNHTPLCTCRDGYSGDPFNKCSPTRMYWKISFSLFSKS